MRTIIAGNWKMHKDRLEAEHLVAALAAAAPDPRSGVAMLVAPPFPFLAHAAEQARGSHLLVAAQNCHEAPHGAFTGEVSVPMLRSIGVQACIVGHSERREHYNETDAAVGRKVAALLAAGLTPIFCCGELRAEREAGRHLDVVATQLHTALGTLPKADIARAVVAYEPVWAIGTGLTASPAQAQEMHAFIRTELRKLADEAADEVPILYGGSCKPDNAAGIFAGADVNGGLIGGASLEAEQFIRLVAIAQEVKTAR